MSLVFPHTFVPWFRSVAPYIHAYRGKTFVVGLAGEAIAAGKLEAFVQDLAILHAIGIKLVLVHGFRPQVTEQLAAKGHVSRFARGIRITDDVGGILQLIEPFERDGTLVRRERTEIERDIANYTVIEHDGIIFGCVALYPYAEERTGEMAALTVSPLSQNQGDGERLLKRVEQRARQGGLDSIFVLTTRTMHWFIKRGFVSVDPEWLPEARKRKYNWDRRSQVLVKKLV